MQTIQEILAKSPYLKAMSLKEALDSYSHIELTPDEVDHAILSAKQLKEEKIRLEESNRIATENRKYLTESKWTCAQTEGFMKVRASSLFDGEFKLDGYNELMFKILCLYFSEDIEFIAVCENLGIKNPSLNKGIMLVGNFGVGKTWLMKLFGKNKRQVFKVVSSKKMAADYEIEGELFSQQYIDMEKNAINDSASFFQKYMGLCIDDLGAEEIKTHFGNKKNVIGDLLETRYSRGTTGGFLHATTNLTAEMLNTKYGGRVTSRMREIFNFIELPGTDRRV